MATEDQLDTSLNRILLDMLHRPVPGDKLHRTYLDVILVRVCNKAIRGNVRATRLLKRLLPTSKK